MMIDRLNLKIDGKMLLQDLSFTIPKGSVFLLLGPNGAGKTLLLRCLTSLTLPSAGSLTNAPQSLAWVPLSQPLPFSFTVEEILQMGRFPKHRGFPSPSDLAAIRTASARIGVLSLLPRVYNSLSRGEQTKVDIARAIASESEWIFLDEPFSNLDIDASLQLIALLKELRDEGRTLVLSHHDLYSAGDLGTHGLLLKQGSLVLSGELQDLLKEGPLEATYGVRPRFSEGRLIQFVAANGRNE